MKLLNKKGMTLFELLAVIIILGIVAAIAFPAVNNLINNTKKDAFVSNGNSFVSYSITQAKAEAVANNEDVTVTYTFGTDAGGEVATALTAAGITDTEDLGSDVPTKNPLGAAAVYGYITISVTVADGSYVIDGVLYTDGTNDLSTGNDYPWTRKDIQ
ncbi:prepilin-type N-terminal cleavage/methylation domain-containing protein [Mycoplasmatota bacterium]|nr:prepilin-type N-terminal cleavage/methylation domain-containing protein [Mycoplasmatota bacterium]